MLSKFAEFVKYQIKNEMTEEAQIEVVEQDGLSIQYIDNPSLKVQLAAVKEDGYAIYHIKNPSLEVQLEAVKEDGYAIQCIDNPLLEVQLEAVRQNGLAIDYIKNPSLEVQLEAVRQNGKALRLIHEQLDSKYFDIIDTSRAFRTIYVFKEPDKEPLFSIGCQSSITKEQFIDRIYNTNGGLENNPHRQKYLDILDRY